MAKINAYQAWLGIPPEQQPPHHYRLLGIEPFETDPAVIERSADRQMTYLRSLKLGEHIETAEKLLSQVSAAKLCLLDPQRREQYDAQLRSKLQTAANERPVKSPVLVPARRSTPVGVPTPPTVSPPAATKASVSTPAAIVTPVVTPALSPARSSTPMARRKKDENMLPIAIGGGAVALLVLLGGAFFIASNMGSDEHASQTPVRPVVEAPVEKEEPPVEEPEVETPVEPATPVAQPASATVDLAFVPGAIGSGQQVLSDRNIAFGKVDPALEGLAFTKHRFGTPGLLEFQATAGGALYLILPPKQFTDPLPKNVKVPGWTTTDLACEIIVDGRKLPCVVLQLAAARGVTGQVPASASVWPILAARRLVSSRPDEVASIEPLPEDLDDEPVATDDPPTVPADEPIPTDDDNPLVGNPPVADPPAENPVANPPKSGTGRQPPVAAAAAPLRDSIAEKFDVGRLQSVDEKLSASRALVSMAEDASTKDDERYVALVVAAELAADAGEVTRALEIVASVGEKFDGSTIDLQLAAVERFIDASAPRAEKERQLASLPPVIERAISAEKFAEVDEIVQDLLKARLNSAVLGEQRKRAVALQDKYEKEVKPAMKVLEQTPADPEANRIVGDYLAVGLQQWPKALPMLAKGDDPLLARVAKSELANPKNAEDQLVVAQGWRSAVNERVGATERGPLMLHAEAWYTKAYPGLPERDRQRAREQLGKLQEDMDKMKWPSPPRPVTIFASCGEAFNISINGKIVLSGIGPGVHSLKATINQGDIILVQAQRALPIREGGVAIGGTTGVGTVQGGDTTVKRPVERYSDDPARRKGFACAIVYEGSTRHIATGAPASPWKNFLTESAAAWQDPKFVRAFDEVMVGGTTGGQQDLIQQAQVNVASIWGGTNRFEAYLFCRIP